MPAAVSRLLLPFCALVVMSRLCAAESGSADEFVVKAWETDDGLPHNQVASVLHRRDGFLWVATLGGVARFDGMEFARVESPLLHGVKSANVFDLIEENADSLVIAANQSGLVRFRHGQATPHPLNAQLAPRTRPMQLFHEADDVFWVLATDRTLWRWAQGHVEKFPPPANLRSWPVSFASSGNGPIFIARGAGVERYEAGALVAVDGLPRAPVTIASGRDGTVWIATARSLARLNADRIAVVAAPPPWNDTQPPTALLEDRHGALWIGATGQGLLRWKDGRVDTIATSHAKITALCEDHEGSVWAATAGGGLDCVQRRRLTLMAEEPDWTDSVVASICEDPAGGMWFANRNAVRKIQPDGRIEIVSDDPGWSKRAAPVVADATGNIWFSVSGDIYRACPQRAEAPRLVDRTGTETHVIFPARDGSIWIGATGRILERITRNGEIKRFGPSTGYHGHNVRAITEDATGQIWIGTSDGRLFAWNGKKFTESSEALGLSGYPIRTIHADTENRLWIGTVGAGVLLVADGTLHPITSAEGLPDDVISHILEDDFGWMWFGCQRGIFKVRTSDLADCALGRTSSVAPIVFGRSDGLSGISAIGNYQPAAWKSRSGELWFVTRKGVIRANPEPCELDPQSLRVHLNALLVDGRPVKSEGEIDGTASTPDSAGLHFASSARRLEFRFTAPTFNAPERVRFRYRLDGFDRDWLTAGAERSATYSALRPGHYRFNVNASRPDGAWSPSFATLAFEITPMWWETWWARAAAIALAVGAVAGFARFWSHQRLRAKLERLEQEQGVERERQRIARDLHDELGASLTHVGMMADELSHDWHALPDPRAHSGQLAECVRHIARDLDAVVWSASPKNDSLPSLASYLSHFAEEFFRHSPIECRLDVAPDLPAVTLSPDARHHLFMIAKELLNNVLKHSQARRLELTMRTTGGAFELVVADDGCGFSLGEAASSGRNGLGNLAARAQEIGGVLGFTSGPAGTTATLRYPLEKR